MNDFSYGGYGGSGWTCHICKAWVPNGCTHNCPTNVAPFPNQPPQVKIDPSVGELRIAAALERIAAALEAANAREKKRV